MVGQSAVELVSLRGRHRHLVGLLRDLVPQILYELQTFGRGETVEVDDAVHLHPT